LIAGIIDTSKDGFISFPEFVAFEGLLCVADALYFIAFRLFDTNGNGLISFDEFEKVIRHTTLYKKIPFNMDGKFVRMYFGRKKNRVVTYAEFSQFLHVIVQSLILILYEIKVEDLLNENLCLLISIVLLQDFQDEYAREAFKKFNRKRSSSGFITIEDFITIMTNIRSHLLTSAVSTKLEEVLKLN
jgi:solute carrier family 25 aspartate/glutamate transporter 12/13